MIIFAALVHASKFAAYNYILTFSVGTGVTSEMTCCSAVLQICLLVVISALLT